MIALSAGDAVWTLPIDALLAVGRAASPLPLPCARAPFEGLARLPGHPLSVQIDLAQAATGRHGDGSQLALVVSPVGPLALRVERIGRADNADAPHRLDLAAVTAALQPSRIADDPDDTLAVVKIAIDGRPVALPADGVRRILRAPIVNALHDDAGHAAPTVRFDGRRIPAHRPGGRAVGAASPFAAIVDRRGGPAALLFDLLIGLDRFRWRDIDRVAGPDETVASYWADDAAGTTYLIADAADLVGAPDRSGDWRRRLTLATDATDRRQGRAAPGPGLLFDLGRLCLYLPGHHPQATIGRRGRAGLPVFDLAAWACGGPPRVPRRGAIVSADRGRFLAAADGVRQAEDAFDWTDLPALPADAAAAFDAVTMAEGRPVYRLRPPTVSALARTSARRSFAGRHQAEFGPWRFDGA